MQCRYEVIFLLLFWALLSKAYAASVNTPAGDIPKSYEIKVANRSDKEKSTVTVNSNPNSSLSFILTGIAVNGHNPSTALTANGIINQAQLQQLNNQLDLHTPTIVDVSPQMVMMALAALPLAAASQYQDRPILGSNSQLSCITTYENGYLVILHTGNTVNGVGMYVTYNGREHAIQISFHNLNDQGQAIIRAYARK